MVDLSRRPVCKPTSQIHLLLNQAIFFIYLKNLFMTDPTNNSEDMLKKLSRRKWLRNAAMAATGAVVLPSFLTGCHKDVWDKLKGPLPGGWPGKQPSS